MDPLMNTTGKSINENTMCMQYITGDRIAAGGPGGD
jgi:hypothetical protein